MTAFNYLVFTTAKTIFERCSLVSEKSWCKYYAAHHQYQCTVELLFIQRWCKHLILRVTIKLHWIPLPSSSSSSSSPPIFVQVQTIMKGSLMQTFWTFKLSFSAQQFLNVQAYFHCLWFSTNFTKNIYKVFVSGINGVSRIKNEKRRKQKKERK